MFLSSLAIAVALQACRCIANSSPSREELARHTDITEFRLTDLDIGEVSLAEAFCQLFVAVSMEDRELRDRYTMLVSAELDDGSVLRGGYSRPSVLFKTAMTDLCRRSGARWVFDEAVLEPDDPVMIKVYKRGGDRL